MDESEMREYAALRVMKELGRDSRNQIGTNRQAEDIRRRKANLNVDRNELAQLMKAIEERNRQRYAMAHSRAGVLPAPAVELRDFYGRTLKELQWQIRFNEGILRNLGERV